MQRGILAAGAAYREVVEIAVSRGNFGRVGGSRDFKYLRHNRHITFDLRHNSRYGPTLPVVKTSKKKKKERRREKRERTREHEERSKKKGEVLCFTARRKRACI